MLFVFAIFIMLILSALVSIKALYQLISKLNYSWWLVIGWITIAGKVRKTGHARMGWGGFLSGKRRTWTCDRRHAKKNYKNNLLIGGGKVSKVSWIIIPSINEDEEEKTRRSWREWSQIYRDWCKGFLGEYICFLSYFHSILIGNHIFLIYFSPRIIQL